MPFCLCPPKSLFPLFEAIELEDYDLSIDFWFPYDVPIPESNTYAMVNIKFALLENNKPPLYVGETSIAPYVTVHCFTLCLFSGLFSVPLPGKEDVAALYQNGAILTAHLIGRVVDALDGFDASRLSQYGHLYRSLDMHTASFIKSDSLLESNIYILVPDTKFKKSSPLAPQRNTRKCPFASPLKRTQPILVVGVLRRKLR